MPTLTNLMCIKDRTVFKTIKMLLSLSCPHR